MFVFFYLFFQKLKFLLYPIPCYYYVLIIYVIILFFLFFFTFITFLKIFSTFCSIVPLYYFHLFFFLKHFQIIILFLTYYFIMLFPTQSNVIRLNFGVFRKKLIYFNRNSETNFCPNSTTIKLHIHKHFICSSNNSIFF